MSKDKDSGTAANRSGMGSTFGGTQSPDPNVPDGYQKPQAGKDAENTDQEKKTGLGEEYADESSYGDKEASPGSSAGEKGDTGPSDARGSGVR